MLFYFVLFCDPAHAYLDPGTGTVLAQIIAMGFIFFITFIKRIGLFFSKVFFVKRFFVKNKKN
jgi:hypothetical protein